MPACCPPSPLSIRRRFQQLDTRTAPAASCCSVSLATTTSPLLVQTSKRCQLCAQTHTAAQAQGAPHTGSLLRVSGWRTFVALPCPCFFPEAASYFPNAQKHQPYRNTAAVCSPVTQEPISEAHFYSPRALFNPPERTMPPNSHTLSLWVLLVKENPSIFPSHHPHSITTLSVHFFQEGA